VALLDDYAGPLDPQFEFSRLSRAALARLGREYLMAGHIHDRALMPIVGSRYGAEAMTDLANDEWMGSSPIYSERNRRGLGIEGDGVSSILKSFQFDIGAPHQYMDFRYELVDEELGYFWLDHCGAYEDISAMARGRTEPITQLCVHMEDLTFDASVMAVNPYARCRAVHRPPLEPGHSGPVCRWQVSITEDHGEVVERSITTRMRDTLAARFEFDESARVAPAQEDGGDAGMDDYAGDFRPDFVLEDLSQRALVRQCKEFALDLHLLVRASHLSIAERWGDAVRAEIAREHWHAAAPIYVERIRAALGMKGDDMGEVLKMLQLDPAFPHDYTKLDVRLVDARRGHVWLSDCDALRDAEPRGWLSLLDDAGAPGFEAVLAAVNPRARVRSVDPTRVAVGGPAAERAWEIVIDESAAPREESNWARAARVSTVVGFELRSGRRSAP